ncbi:MAG TPA: cupin domain-containing protein [Dongiaceae bacterium]
MDWLSSLLDMMPVSGRLEIRCLYGAPWRIAYDPSAAGEIPYHVVLEGTAVLKDPAGGPPQHLKAGDILLLPTGAAHILHDGSGAPPAQAQYRAGMNQTISENAGTGDRLDLLCGRFILTPPHGRLMGAYLPARLIVRGVARGRPSATATALGAQLANLVALMRAESDNESLGGQAMLNAFSAALFTLTLRRASESNEAPAGLLALAGHPRLAPALSAMFHKPAHPWTLPELAGLCNMSRATLARHFQERLGHSANDLLLDIRMTLASNELKNPARSTAAVSEMVGYQSEAAFQRAFKQHMGMSPAQWRRAAAATG